MKRGSVLPSWQLASNWPLSISPKNSPAFDQRRVFPSDLLIFPKRVTLIFLLKSKLGAGGQMTHLAEARGIRFDLNLPIKVQNPFPDLIYILISASHLKISSNIFLL